MAMSPFQTFANREVADLTFCDYATGKVVLYFPYANTTATALTGDIVHARGGMGAPRRVPFGGAREGTLTVETQMNCAQLYAMVLGGSLSTSAEFLKRFVVVAADGVLTLPEQSGEILSSGLSVYPASDDCGVEVENPSIADGVISADGLNDGEEYVVYCMVKHDGDVQKLHVGARIALKAFKIYGVTLVKDEAEIERATRMICYKATPQPSVEFSFANQGDPASMTITFDLAADKDDNVLDMIFMDEGL